MGMAGKPDVFVQLIPGSSYDVWPCSVSGVASHTRGGDRGGWRFVSALPPGHSWTKARVGGREGAKVRWGLGESEDWGTFQKWKPDEPFKGEQILHGALLCCERVRRRQLRASPPAHGPMGRTRITALDALSSFQ